MEKLHLDANQASADVKRTTASVNEASADDAKTWQEHLDVKQASTDVKRATASVKEQSADDSPPGSCQPRRFLYSSNSLPKITKCLKTALSRKTLKTQKPLLVSS